MSEHPPAPLLRERTRAPRPGRGRGVEEGAMAPKGEKIRPQRWRPKAGPNSPWLEQTAGRLEERAARQPHPDAAPGGASVAHTAAARLAAEREAGRGGQRASGSAAGGYGDEVSATTVMDSQREYYRTGAGMTASTFEPQRNTMMVLGRPVQVLSCSRERL